jgi:transcription elongation factor Elf1
MATYDVRFTCAQCGGDGLVTLWLNDVEQGTDTCPMCEGTGKMKIGELDLSDIDDAISDVMGKCNDIFEKVNE